MNPTEKPSDLGQLLRDWAERMQSSERIEDLRTRILASWQAEQSAGPAERPRASAPAPRWALRRPAAWVGTAAAAAAVLAVCVTLALRPWERGGPTGPEEPLPPQFAWLERSQLAEKAVLLREMDRLFDHRLEWIGETDGRVLMELRQDAEAPRAAGVAVRLVVVRRQGAGEDWTPVWAIDLVARQEEVVRLTPETADLPKGAELALWAYPVGGEMIAVDCELSLAELPIDASHSGVQPSGVPVAVDSVRQGGVEYRVFQTVAILDDEA
jgi:hypothetical protein